MGKGETPAKPSAPRFLVVGIGASAGGLEAMMQLLRALPDKPGMALVLVQHLDPTHDSAMAALLSRATAMPVVEAKHNMALGPDRVYVIPPNKQMGVARRRLKLSPRVESRDTYTPIDHFLKSLAGAEGSRAIGVILSGSGGMDGTQGLLAIKAAGGITFAQDEASAKYPSMPASAVAAGCVDFVLPPEGLARELARLAGDPYVGPAAEEAAPEPPAEAKALENILACVRRVTGMDFTQYKQATLQRRIQRRMVLHKLESLQDYAAYLPRHANEARELFSDILIHVTGFFRDPAVFQVLKRRVLPRLLKGRAPREPLRVWVPGCSTGEEVYSLAMALLEVMAEKRQRRPVQVFGTDINEAALAKARLGVYPESIRGEVSAERLRRFFLRAEGGYRVNKAVREVCIFARQNLISDPPFSNLDLVSCRNVLIYLGPTLQRRVLPLFHYALKPSGCLLLGGSETIGGFADLFALVDKKAKVYTKKLVVGRHAVVFGPVGPRAAGAEQAPAPAARVEYAPALADVQRQADRIVLTQHSPAGVVINRQFDVLQFRGRTGLYLEHGHGEATLNLLKMAREGLAASLRAAVTRALRKEAPVRDANAAMKHDGGYSAVAIQAVPFQVPTSREWFCLVLFEPAPPPAGKAAKGRAAAQRGSQAADAGAMTRLREELAATRESLQTIIHEQETTNEELRSANEEIMSSNEELQSTNEELETAKEELQSTNEELATLNDELESRNTELEHVNNDLHNLLLSVSLPVVIVGPDLRIRRFTAFAERMLNLLPSDLGRPLTDINLRVAVPQLGTLIVQVLDTLQAKDLDVQDADGHWWSLRIRPYKTTENVIDGAVIALVDIHLLKSALERAAERRAFAEAVVKTVREPLVILDGDLVVRNVNDAFYRTFRVKPEDTISRRIYELGHGEWNIPALRSLLEDVLPHNSSFQDFEVEHDFPGIGHKKMLLNARRMAADAGQSPLILLAIEEVALQE